MSNKRSKRGSSGIQWEIVKEDVEFERNFHLGNRKLIKSQDFDYGFFGNTEIGDESYVGFNAIDPISDCFPIDVEDEEQDDGKSYVLEYCEGNEVKCVKCEEEVELCDKVMETETGNDVTGCVGKEEVREAGKRSVPRGDRDWSWKVGCRSIGVSGYGGGRTGKGKRVVDDEDKIDSHYKMFLENMRVKEDYYVLEAEGDGEVKCAMRDESGDEIQIGMMERLKSYYDGENMEEDFLKCGLRGEKNKSSKTLTQEKTRILGNMTNDLGKERCSTSVGALKNSSGRKRKNDYDDEDRYKKCPKTWRDGKSIVFEVSDTDEVDDAADDEEEKISRRYKMFPKNRRDGMSSVVGVLAIDEVDYIKHGKEDESCDEIKLGKQKRLKSSLKGEKMKKCIRKSVSGGEKNSNSRNASIVLEKENTKRPGNRKDDLRKKCCRPVGISTIAADRKAKSVKVEMGVTSKYCLNGGHLSKDKYNLKGPHVKVDETYKTVGCLRNSGNEMSCSQRGIEQVQYVKHKNVGHAMISHEESCEKMYCTNEEHIGHMKNKNVSVDKKGSRFMERLMDILKKPYNQEEYDNLMRQVSRRKLEGRGRKYGSKSLLDQHMDLVRKIDLVHSDNHQVLNLLRGFTYWLQHLVDKRSFPPWKNPECLKMLPES